MFLEWIEAIVLKLVAIRAKTGLLLVAFGKHLERVNVESVDCVTKS